jgi:enterochelin esterase family protein
VRAELAVDTPTGPVEVTVRSPGPAADRLLLVHDGPEYDELAALGSFTAALARDRRLPPFQLALAAPGARDERYSADPGYTGALATRVLPELHRQLGTSGPAVLMGASLGALAALHLQRRHPDLVGGLFLQSGSFFTRELDDCESGFPHFGRIVDAVAAVRRNRPAGRPVPTVLTCGSAEENRHNNRAMEATLSGQGYPVVLHEVPDAHNYVAWRDTFDPHLADLLASAWGSRHPGSGAVRDG